MMRAAYSSMHCSSAYCQLQAIHCFQVSKTHHLLHTCRSCQTHCTLLLTHQQLKMMQQTLCCVSSCRPTQACRIPCHNVKQEHVQNICMFTKSLRGPCNTWLCLQPPPSCVSSPFCESCNFWQKVPEVPTDLLVSAWEDPSSPDIFHGWQT